MHPAAGLATVRVEGFMDALLLVENCVSMHAEQAWRLAISLSGNAADADDLVQQSLIVAWRKAEHAPRDTWPWLAGILTNEARNLRRKRALRSHAPLSEDSAMSIDRRPERAELSRLIDSALQSLPEDQREAIVLTHLSGFTQQQAADIAGVPLNTLKARVRRGLDNMRERLNAREEEITLALAALPIAMPPGGLTTAQIAWTAGVQQYAATAATAAVATSKAKMLALGTAALLAIAALLLVLIQDQFRPSPRLDEVGKGTTETSETPQRAARKKASSSADEADGPGRKPAGIQGQPPEPSDAPGRQPPADGGSSVQSGETGQGGPRGAIIKIPNATADDSGGEGRTPPGQEFEDVSRSPVLWLADWPPKYVKELKSPGPAHVASALRAFEKVWDDPRSDDEKRFKVLLNLPNGDADLVPAIMRALASPCAAHQRFGVDWIMAQSEKRCLEVLEALLWELRDGVVGPKVVHAMFRNPHWVELRKWEKGVAIWIRQQWNVASELVATFLLEMGYVRGDYGSNENRQRALVVLDAADQLERKREPDAMILRNLRIALENLARAGFVDAKERSKIERKLRGKDVKPDALMKLRRTYKVQDRSWDVTTIDVNGPRAHAYPLVVLCDPEVNAEHWLPWLIEADAHFRCYLLEYRGWRDDMGRQESGDWAESLAADLALVIRQLGLKQYGVLARGCVAPVGAELCHVSESGVAFAALDSWESANQIVASLKGDEQDESKLGPAARTAINDLQGSSRPTSGWRALELQDAIMAGWLAADRPGDAPRDAYARQAPMLSQTTLIHAHPIQRLAKYEFRSGTPISQPVLVLSSRWPESAVESDSRLRRAFNRPHAPEQPLGTRPAWTMPADQWMAQIVAMLEDERLIRKK